MLKHHVVKKYGEVKIQINASLTSAFNGGVCSTSRSDHLDHLLDMRLSHRVILDTVTRIKFPPIAIVNCRVGNAVVCSLLLTELAGLSLFANSLILTSTVNMMSGAPEPAHDILTSDCQII